MKSFAALGPTPPYPIVSGNSVAIGDFDGDGRVEVASFCPTTLTLHVLTYFAWTDVTNIPGSPNWPSGSGGCMIDGWCCTALIPPGNGLSQGWPLRIDDQFYSVKVNAQSSVPSLVAFNPTTLNFGLLQWNSGQMELIWLSPTPGQAAKGFGLNALDTFLVQDVDHDGAEELVRINLSDYWLMTFKWTGQLFECIQAEQLQIQDWQMAGTDVYLKANIPALGGGNLVVISQGQAQAGILSLNARQYNCTVGAVPSVFDPRVKTMVGVFRNFLPTQSTFFTADIDGDGTDEIVGINPAGIVEPPIILKWNGSAFQPLVELQTFPTYLNTLDVVFGVMPLAGAPALILTCNQGSTQLTAQAYASSALQTQWSGQAIGTDPIYWTADFNGDGNPELLVVDVQTRALGLFSWTPPSGSTPAALTPISTGFLFLPGWSVQLFAQAPPAPYGLTAISTSQQATYFAVSEKLYPLIQASLTNCTTCQQTDLRSCYSYLNAADFTALLGTLNQYQASLTDPTSDTLALMATLTNDFLYGYISDTLDPNSESDIRTEYTNLTYGNRSQFGAYADRLVNTANAAYITPMPGAAIAVWTPLANQLSNEMAGLASVILWAGSEVMGSLNSQLSQIQSQALNYAYANVSSAGAIDNDSNVPLVMENVLDAVLWGVAAIGALSEAVPGSGIVLSMVASMFPMAAALSESSSQPAQLTVPYSEIAGQISQIYGEGVTQVTNTVVALSANQITLPLVGALLNGLPGNNLWRVTSPQINAYANAALTPSYLGFYSVLIPAAFQMWSYQSVTRNTPFYCSTSTYPPAYWQSTIDAPAYSYLVESAGPGRYNIYMLCQGSDGSNLDFPPQEMFQDLFTNLGVSETEFFEGQGIWAGIPVVQPDISNCASGSEP